ncbi:MAG: D-amino-acid dehydrogenase, partial [bacterium]
MTQNNQPNTVTVLGAGIVGVCCALSLQERGYQVTLIDRLLPGEATSYGNAGVISPWSCVPQCMPGTFRQIPGLIFKANSPVSFRWQDLINTLPWMVRFLGNTHLSKVEPIADAMDRLMHNNVASYKKFLSDTGQENLLVDSWYLNVFKGAMRPSLADLAWKLRIDRGAPIRIIDGAELRDIEPHLGASYHSAVVIEGQSRTIAPGRLCKALAELALSQGMIMKTAEVQVIQPLPEAGYELVCDGETIAAQRLVVAGGIWSAELLRPLGFKIPLIAERGYHLEFANPGVTLTHSVADVAGRFVVSSMENGIRAA